VPFLSKLTVLTAYESYDLLIRDPDNPKKDHYIHGYIVVYVDDLGIAPKKPGTIIKELEGRYGFKLIGTGPTTFHL
jgi:hypothetical protein